MAAPPVFELEGAAIGPRRGHAVLERVQLAIGAGERWFVVGPNGSGKTTLLRALLGVQPLLAGRIHRDPARGARAALGYVPQRCDLAPGLPTTVQELVELGLVGAAVARRERPALARAAIAQVGLGPQARRDYHSLSGGQRQRALIARALVRQPRTLLADEPTSGLDLRAQHDLLAELDHLHRAGGLTLVLVTHDIALAARHASHVALLHDGELLAGTREAVLGSERLAAVYGRGLVREVARAAAGQS